MNTEQDIVNVYDDSFRLIITGPLYAPWVIEAIRDARDKGDGVNISRISIEDDINIDGLINAFDAGN